MVFIQARVKFIEETTFSISIEPKKGWRIILSDKRGNKKITGLSKNRNKKISIVIDEKPGKIITDLIH